MLCKWHKTCSWQLLSVNPCPTGVQLVSL